MLPQTPEEIYTANKSLMAFIESDMSWVWTLDLLKYDDEFVRFFSANILLTKAKRHWSALNKEQRTDILNFLHNTLQEFAILIMDIHDCDTQGYSMLRVIIVFNCEDPSF